MEAVKKLEERLSKRDGGTHIVAALVDAIGRDPAVFDVFFQHFAGEFRNCLSECPVTARQSMSEI